MAYNNGFPMGYQPYPQTTYAQQYQQSQQYQNQQAQPSPNLIWVQGEAAAKSYPVAPNSSVPLWDSEADVIYIKSADMSGMPSLKILDYTMRNVAPRSADISPQSGFATKDDISHLKEELDALKAKFERMGDKRKEKSDGKQSVQRNE